MIKHRIEETGNPEDPGCFGGTASSLLPLIPDLEEWGLGLSALSVFGEKQEIQISVQKLARFFHAGQTALVS